MAWLQAQSSPASTVRSTENPRHPIGAPRCRRSDDFLRIAQLTAQGLLISLVFVGGATPASAQSWPHRTVKFILPLGPGSGTDIGARLFADKLAVRWNKPVVVENRPGGDGVIAINAFIGADDDHTLLFAPSGTFTVHPFVREKVPYDVRDLVPIARISNTIVGIAIPASLKADSLTELVALARAQPGKLNWSATSGMTNIVMSSFIKSSGLEVAKVPYRELSPRIERPDREQAPNLRHGIGHRAVAGGRGKGPNSGADESRTRPHLPQHTDGNRGRLSCACIGRFGRPVRPSQNVERVA